MPRYCVKLKPGQCLAVNGVPVLEIESLGEPRHKVTALARTSGVILQSNHCQLEIGKSQPELLSLGDCLYYQKVKIMPTKLGCLEGKPTEVSLTCESETFHRYTTV